MSRAKKMLLIHDMSGVGRSSLAVILPTIAVLGVQPCPVPTAVLSTHTGGFGTPVVADLTSYIQDALGHYQEQELEFDAVYTGYLSSSEQADICIDYFDAYPQALHIVDPVLGDSGKAYRGITHAIQQRMRELVKRAQIVIPNPTEIGLLLGRPGEKLEQWEDVKGALVRLGEMGPKQVLLTGAHLQEGCLENVLYDREKEQFYRLSIPRIPTSYPGTGDIFSSVLSASLLNGKTPPEAMAYATEFLSYTIKTSYNIHGKQKNQTRFGVELERCLSWFYTQPHPLYMPDVEEM